MKISSIDSALVLHLAFALPACSSGPKCSDADYSCTGNVANTCSTFGRQDQKDVNHIPCTDGNICVTGKGFSGCAASATPCAEADNGKTLSCSGASPVSCQSIQGETVTVYYPVAAAACANGNTCQSGLCLASSVACDPATFVPSCQDGKPLGCPANIAGAAYPTFMSPPCADLGNQCLTGDGYAGCTVDGSICDSNDAVNAPSAACKNGKFAQCSWGRVSTASGVATMPSKSNIGLYAYVNSTCN